MRTGDGMLAEFSSVVDAVRCAVRGMAQRNTDIPQDQRIGKFMAGFGSATPGRE
jgi:class 3 adenylate cyclase